MLANRTSRWSIATAVLCAALLAASWFLLISPRRADAAALREQATQSDAQADQLRTHIAELKAEFADLPKRRDELNAIKLQLPPTADIPDLVRSMRALADQSGVSLDSMTPATPAVLAASGAPAPTGAGPGSVVGIPLQMVVTGDYFEAVLFVKSLQTKLQRSMLITSLSLAPAEAPSTTATPTTGSTATPTVTAAPAPDDLQQVTLNLTTSVFVLMDGTSTLEDVTKAAAAAAVGTPTATPTASAS